MTFLSRGDEQRFDRQLQKFRKEKKPMSFAAPFIAFFVGCFVGHVLTELFR